MVVDYVRASHTLTLDYVQLGRTGLFGLLGCPAVDRHAHRTSPKGAVWGVCGVFITQHKTMYGVSPLESTSGPKSVCSCTNKIGPILVRCEPPNVYAGPTLVRPLVRPFGVGLRA